MTAVATCGALAGPASAAAPILGDSWSQAVGTSTARLQAEIDPDGLATGYHFDYITEAAYQANLSGAKAPFTGAKRSPVGADAKIGSGTTPLTVVQFLSALSVSTKYRYRVVATNSAGTSTGPTQSFTTRDTGGGTVPAAGRGWEMVSPVDKNGGEVAAPGELAGGGLFQAAAGGGAISWGSAASFAGDAAGAPPASQYLTKRSSGGWSTQNISPALFSASYTDTEGGTPHRLFSPDLSRALVSNGDRCRSEGEECAVVNPPVPGSGAPAGYRNYYLVENGVWMPLVGAAEVARTAVGPEHFELALVGATTDLSRSVLSTCAKLTANASEVPDGEGCDSEEQNLYLSSSAGLSLVNILPAQSVGTPGAELAAPAGAIAENGSRVYFTLAGNLYLREGAATKQVDADAGGGGVFEAASADGSVAFFSKAGHLWRYAASTDSATDITPAGGVIGVLGASTAGDRLFFQDATALKRWNAGTTTVIAPGSEAAAPSNWPAATGTARVSPDGARLLFQSLASEGLSEYDNTDLNTGLPDSQVYLWDGALACLSCNPTGARPTGASSLPGAIANGSTGPAYKPRALSANGKRVFFDSADAIAPTDTNERPDAYQWEAQGEGSCNRAGGCVSLLSSGRDARPSTFLDASADGSDAFFITAASLVEGDPGSFDLYDARIGGGFPVPPPPILCEGDACQPLPPSPADPTLTTLLTGPGNPGVRFPGLNCRPKQLRAEKLAKVAARLRKRAARGQASDRAAATAAKQAARARIAAARCNRAANGGGGGKK